MSDTPSTNDGSSALGGIVILMLVATMCIGFIISAARGSFDPACPITAKEREK